MWSISRAGASGTHRTSRRFQVGVPRSGLWIGSEVVTYHITSCTVRPILTGPTTGLNATPALGRAPLPRSPACPEHVRWAEQMFIAVSVRRKPRGKGGCLVPQKATRHVASQPCAGCRTDGHALCEGLALCLECLHHTGGRGVLAMLSVHRQWETWQTARRRLNSQGRMELPVQPSKGETRQNKTLQ